MSEDACPTCGKVLEVGDWPFCHGSQAEHGKFRPDHLAVIDDSIPGGMVVENMGHEPLKFYSKSEWKAEMKRRGLVNKVQHVGVPGSDRSPVTTKWY